MKRIDYFIFGGLTISLILFLYLTSLSTSSQNTTVIENQRLIRQALTITQNNSERIIENQESILNISKSLQRDRDLLLEHSDITAQNLQGQDEFQNQLLNIINNNTGSNRNMTIQNREMIQFLRDTLDEMFIAELKQNQILTEQKLDIMLLRLTNGSQGILDMTKRPSTPQSSPD
jgi:hypothetical protein